MTPLFVIRALNEVLDSGLTDLTDRDAVEMTVWNQRAAEWLNKATNAEYLEALRDMNASNSDDWMGTETRTAAMEEDDIYESYAQARNGEEPGDDEERLNPFDLDGTDR